MLKEIKKIKKGVIRITSLNERWYAKVTTNPMTGKKEYSYYPSSTWISGYYPKGEYFYKWLAGKGWSEAEAVKQAAADKGSRVHKACEELDKGKAISVTQAYLNPRTKMKEELSKDEVDCIISYRDFLDEVKPELLAQEITSFGDVYAGTADKIFRIKESPHTHFGNESLRKKKEGEATSSVVDKTAKDDKKMNRGQVWIVDLKTSQSIWPEHELQISSYSHMHFDLKSMGITEKEWKNRRLAILQIGYRKNKKGYKFTEVTDKYHLFKNAYKVWQHENDDQKPKERDYPNVIVSVFRKQQYGKRNKG